MAGPKIDKRSILGIATASSGKRQELDSELACPTPTNQVTLIQYIFYLSFASSLISPKNIFSLFLDIGIVIHVPVAM